MSFTTSILLLVLHTLTDYNNAASLSLQMCDYNFKVGDRVEVNRDVMEYGGKQGKVVDIIQRKKARITTVQLQYVVELDNGETTIENGTMLCHAKAVDVHYINYFHFYLMVYRIRIVQVLNLNDICLMNLNIYKYLTYPLQYIYIIVHHLYHLQNPLNFVHYNTVILYKIYLLFYCHFLYILYNF